MPLQIPSLAVLNEKQKWETKYANLTKSPFTDTAYPNRTETAEYKINSQHYRLGLNFNCIWIYKLQSKNQYKLQISPDQVGGQINWMGTKKWAKNS